MNEIALQQIREILKQSKKVLVVPSTPMDGDSIGSALALMAVLRKMGKEVTVASAEPVPESLRFLPMLNQIQTELSGANSSDFVITLNTSETDVDHLKYEVEQGKINIIVTPKQGQFTGHDLSFASGPANFDLIIAVDTGDLVQLGKIYEDNKELFASTTFLNIDHHKSNGMFGTHNYVDPEVAATTQIITPLVQELEKDLGMQLFDADIATLLLVGIVTDTGSFQHTNTTPEAFEVAADLLDYGARQQEIIKHIYKTKSLATLKLWGRVLSRIKQRPDQKLVYSIITQQDLAETGASPDDSGGIIDELLTNAPGAEVVFLLKEKAPGFISGSMRAPGQIADVSQIAASLGGGGHKKAAGFRIKEKTMDEAIEMAITAVAQHMNEVQAPQPQQPTSQDPNRLFPSLVVHPEVQKPQTSVPTPSPGGEDLLLQDFRARQDEQEIRQDERKVEEASVKFFQDPDGQESPIQPIESQSTEKPIQEKTVGEVLSDLGQN